MAAYSRNIGTDLDIKAQERLGIGGAQVKPPVGKLKADTVCAVYLRLSGP
jgi:hypothetical protein